MLRRWNFTTLRGRRGLPFETPARTRPRKSKNKRAVVGFTSPVIGFPEHGGAATGHTRHPGRGRRQRRRLGVLNASAATAF